uniref:Uncharacterized protein n=1 Tax=Aegilops tauschii subsp. strangulata TaxID=200361 RepID=A0A453AN48_AEGTS
GEMASAMAGKKMGRASYIRIKHEEERHEASWKEPEGWVFSATTRTDVAARLGELRDQILAGCASPSRPRRTALRLLLRPPRRRPRYASTCPTYALCRLSYRVSDRGEPEAPAQEELDSVEVLPSQ